MGKHLALPDDVAAIDVDVGDDIGDGAADLGDERGLHHAIERSRGGARGARAENGRQC